MNDNKHETMDWALWFYWIMATTLGWIFGNLFFNGIPIIMSGAVVAAFQSVVLYKRIQKAWRWAVLSSLGWITGYILALFFLPTNMGFLFGGIMGGTVGLVQWLILRMEMEWSGWWVVISIMAWTTGLNLMPGFLTSGALPGALTGLALIVLFRFSAPRTRRL
jgi:hypothetical protein